MSDLSYVELAALASDLELRVTRLRKAVNWLRGAYHDVHEERQGQFQDDCDVWECQRARDILEDER